MPPEPSAATGRDAERAGHYSESDYWSLPEGRRAELIDGELLDMAPPSRIHQDIAGELAYALRSHVKAHGGPCKVYEVPFSVNLRATALSLSSPTSRWSATRASSRTEGARGRPTS